MNIVREDNIKVVLDTNILISALFFGGKPHKIFNLILEKEIIGITSPYIIFELEEVLRRRKFNINEERIKEVTELIKEFFEVVISHTKLNLINNSHPDNKILALTIDAKANYLITGDKQHLLPLKNINKTKIVSAEEFLTLENLCLSA